MNKRILVCGASGFMGTNITNFLNSRGYKVDGTCLHSVAKVPCDVFTVDLTEPGAIAELFRTTQPDVVIQAAAVTSGAKDILERPYLHVTNNAVMNSYLLRACYDFMVPHFIFLSCSVMYQPSMTPIREIDWSPGTPILPQYFGVGATKVYVEQMCEFYSRLGRTKHTVIRHSNTYGPHDKFDALRSHVMGASIRKVVKERSAKIWGTGNEIKDLIFVSDVARAIEIFINKQTDAFERINVSSGTGISINDLVTKIIQHSGQELEITHDLTKPTIPVNFVYDNSYAREKYGWVPEVSMDEGIRKTILWFKENYNG